jgi:hypothetical protein
MDYKNLKDRVKQQKSKYITIDGFEFQLTALNGIDMTRMAFIARSNPNKQIEVEMILESITDYKNIKVKDLLVDCSPEEAEDEVPFDKDLLSEFLGRNQEIMIKLYEEIGTRMEEYNKKNDNQKKT